MTNDLPTPPDDSRPGAPGSGMPNPSQSAPQQPAPEADFGDIWQLIVGGAVIGTALVGVAAVYQWMSPWTPFVAALSLGTLLGATVAGLFCDRDRVKSIGLAVATWAILSVPTLAWASATVRAAVGSWLAASLPASAQVSLLDDPAQSVRYSAVQQLSDGGSAAVRGRLIGRLAESPKVAMQHLDAIANQHPAGAHNMASQLLGRWTSAASEQRTDAVCTTAPYVSEIAPMSNANPAHALSWCALTAAADPAAPDMAACCAQALVDDYPSADQYVAALGPPSEIESARRHQLFKPMMAYAFTGLDATRAQLPTLTNQLLRQPATRRWLTALGCQGMLTSALPESYRPALQAIADTKSCPAPPASSEAAKTADWQHICETLADQPDDAQNLCGAIDQQSRLKAANEASARVHHAIAMMASGKLSRFIAATPIDADKDQFDQVYDRILEPVNTHGATQWAQSPKMRQLQRMLSRHRADSKAVLKEQMPNYKNADLSDYKKLVQNLHKKISDPKMNWSEAKKHMSKSEIQKFQPKIDQLNDRVDNTSNVSKDDPLLNVLK